MFVLWVCISKEVTWLRVSQAARFFWLACLIDFDNWHLASSQELSIAAADPWQIIQTNYHRIYLSWRPNYGLLKNNLTSEKNRQIIREQITHTLYNLSSGFMYKCNCTNECCPNWLQVVQLHPIWKLHSSFFSQHNIKTKWLPYRGDKFSWPKDSHTFLIFKSIHWKTLNGWWNIGS